ncbi:hypothetical protein JHN55_29010 [Streptomyces sp. MBT56]|uniref:hypothetical protein n=1 Tax=unclassified Streptomyces TaxID=2593676 RepID=UPI00190D95B1|nr:MULTISPECIES: hypothetical protein [unclassified Streptomyces]MBK3560498.1 hypothetical protein [Streptomyces sp. MBT56]MBK3600162.1 hypothetical protein [Streptomyces sp. MBT54]MBK3613520.1 hypothetical protein [Streptomyces sp. MBT98]
MSVALTAPGPDLRLLVSLAAWTWPGAGPDGREIAHILITHTTALTDGGTAVTAEDRMRGLSACLGGLTGAREVIPELRPCLQLVGGHVMLHIPGASRRLRLPTRRPWTELVTRTGEAILLLGLDPLPQSAGAARLDAYLDAALATDRLLFGRVQLPPSAPRADVCSTCGGSGTDPTSGRACPDCSLHCRLEP